MNKEKIKLEKRDRRKAKIRSQISGTKNRPRLNVFKSNKEMFLQAINDEDGKTLVSAHSKEVKIDKKSKEGEGGKIAIAFELGKLLGKKALDNGIKEVIFDRGGNIYHGRIKAAAEGAREAGLKF